jgi:hypothetical protein
VAAGRTSPINTLMGHYPMLHWPITAPTIRAASWFRSSRTFGFFFGVAIHAPFVRLRQSLRSRVQTLG